MNHDHTKPQLKLACILFGLICLFSFLGAFAATRDAAGFLTLFHLDRELNLVTLFSALLLFTSGWIIHRHWKTGAQFPPAVRLLGFLFLFMAADECLKIHETVEKLIGVDWQILYLPLILAAGAGWLRVWFFLRGFRSWLWILGAAAWGSSQLLEAAQWGWWIADSPADRYLLMMISEEILEMAGSAFFLLTLRGAVISAHAASVVLPLHEHSREVVHPEKAHR